MCKKRNCDGREGRKFIDYDKGEMVENKAVKANMMDEGRLEGYRAGTGIGKTPR